MLVRVFAGAVVFVKLLFFGLARPAYAVPQGLKLGAGMGGVFYTPHEKIVVPPSSIARVIVKR